MAKAGRAEMTIDFSDFEGKLEIALDRVQRGTKKATVAACEEILADSLSQVPRDTETLASSAYYEIHGSYKNFSATIGYGGNGDPVNTKTGQHASDYMVVVHEDLSANHPIGKAKYLEDPVKNYQAKFGPNAANFIRNELG